MKSEIVTCWHLQVNFFFFAYPLDTRVTWELAEHADQVLIPESGEV